MKCDFTHNHFRDILEKALNHPYRICSLENFVEKPSDSSTLLLRHDVDFSLQKALPLARIEAQFSIRATYFIRVRGLYNLLKPENIDMLKQLREWNHEIGLHFEAELFLEDCERQILRDKKFLESILDADVKGFSLHSINRLETLYGIDNLPQQLTKHFDYYAGRFRLEDKFRYISDSNRYWRDGCACKHIGNEERLYVNIHPFWWSEKPLPVVTLIENAIRGEIL